MGKKFDENENSIETPREIVQNLAIVIINI